MRGKLRDKRAAAKRDVFKRETLERRRPAKRDNRIINRAGLQVEDEDFELTLDEEEGEDEKKIEIPQKK